MSPAQAHRILVSDPLDEAALTVFREHGLEPTVRTGLPPEELLTAVADIEALVVRSGTKVTREVLEAAPNLRVVGRAGIGVDNVDCKAATERGVVVMNTPTGNATTTAEHAIALLVSLARHIPRADRCVRTGQWKAKKQLIGTELTGKTLGVVGFGRIGRLVAQRAQGLAMKVVAHDPYLDPATGSGEPDIELLALDGLLARADFVTLHVPLTDATRGLLSWEQFARIRPGARVINASRGGIVDEEALLDALVDGRVAGAALDVFETEPPPDDHPLLARDDVVLTPHLGASSAEAQHKVAVDIAHQVADFLHHGVAQNAVNAPALAAAELRELGPYIDLAERCGSFLAQRTDGPIRKIELTVAGAITERDIGHLRLAVLVGVLRATLDQGVNFVNAPILAKERGIRILESTDSEPYFVHGQIKVRASARGGEDSHVVAGTVFGREPRFVRIDDVHLDLAPQGPLLLTKHSDVPGVVGALGTVLGKHGINIRRVELGPPVIDGGHAAGFLSLYERPGPDVLGELSALDPIEEARLVELGP